MLIHWSTNLDIYILFRHNIYNMDMLILHNSIIYIQNKFTILYMFVDSAKNCPNLLIIKIFKHELQFLISSYIIKSYAFI